MAIVTAKVYRHHHGGWWVEYYKDNTYLCFGYINNKIKLSEALDIVRESVKLHQTRES